LTRDGELSKAAKLRNVKVYGILWLLDQIVEYQIIMPKEAAQALERMLAPGAGYCTLSVGGNSHYGEK